MSLVVITGIFVAFYGYELYKIHEVITINPDIGKYIFNFRSALFSILGLFFITVVSSSYFSDLGQKTKAIFELMIPASRLEKFLASIFYTVIVVQSVYFLLYFLVDLAFVSYVKNLLNSVSNQPLAKGGTANSDNLVYFFQLFKNEGNDILKFYFLPFLLNALFLLGSIAYKNFHYIKTAITMIIYIAIWSLTFAYVMKLRTDNTISLGNNTYFGDKEHVFELFLVIGVILTLIFWGLAFLRLKEKEV
jgi:hypothetical protein